MAADHASSVRRVLTDVPKLCDALGIERSRTERGKWTCPRHGGGSLNVRVARDGTIQVRCFGCDLAGDVFTLIAEARGWSISLDFREVLLEAARLGGLWGVARELEGSARSGHPARRPPTPPPRPPRRPGTAEAVPVVDDPAFDRVASALLDLAPLDGPLVGDVRDYLAARRLLDLARDAGWGALPPPRAQARIVEALAERFGSDTLIASGLCPTTGRLRLSWDENRLVIPYRTPGVTGTIHTLQRRAVDRHDSRHKYVFPRERGKPRYPYFVAGDTETSGSSTTVFCEGAVDVLALRWLCAREGVSALVLGIPGVENWRPEWATFAAGRKAVLALDADRAGDEAIDTRWRDLHVARDVVRWRPKEGKDWGEYLALVKENP